MDDTHPIDPISTASTECNPSDRAGHDELLSALEEAKSGTKPDSARALMQEIVRRVRSGDRSIMPFVENWIVHAFGKIIEDGYSADQAFGLEGRQGHRERPDTIDRDIVATAMVILAMRAKEKWEDAIWNAASQLFDDDHGESVVKAAYVKYKDSLNLLPSPTLAALIPD